MGVTSDKNGGLEIMIHRSLSQDDGRGSPIAVQLLICNKDYLKQLLTWDLRKFDIG
jgi:hypothetical protein